MGVFLLPSVLPHLCFVVLAMGAEHFGDFSGLVRVPSGEVHSACRR